MTATTSRFDPAPGQPYGKCEGCEGGLVLRTRQEAEDHMAETLASAPDRRSHSVRIENPTRPERVRTALRGAVNDAVRDAVDEVDRMVDDGDMTEEEARSGLSDEFLDEFEDRRR